MTFKKFYLLLIALLLAGSMSAQSTYRSALPFKSRKGVNVGGIVECDGRPVKGVMVSDGYHVTSTDSSGAYYLHSEKKNPQIFITTPSGYEPYREDVVPQFWADIVSPPGKFERHDFRLVKRDNSRHALFVTTDMHFHGRFHDELTFKTYIDVINREMDSLANLGIPVYSIGLGDISYDCYWYESGVDIEKTRDILNKNGWRMPFYNIMGNHDSDGAVCAGDSTDFKSAQRYMSVYGPRYYSQNIGDIHYVMLDNIIYNNTPVNHTGYEGINGKRDYLTAITPEQLEWLEKDLSHISSSTPLVISLHSPVHKIKKITGDVAVNGDKVSAMRLKKLTARFNKVHFLSGHTHRNALIRINNGDGEIIDHNLLSTCGAIWWNSGLNQKNIAHDGNPVGFALYEMYGDSISWRFIPYEYPKKQQFKTWDVESLQKYFNSDSEILAMRKHLSEWGDYSEYPANSLLVQVWDWDPAGSLVAEQNQSQLNITPITATHPDYYAVTALSKSVWYSDYRKSRATPRKAQMFLVTPVSDTSPVEVTYTDGFGRRSSQMVKRGVPYTPWTLLPAN